MQIGVIDLPVDDIISGAVNGLPAPTRQDWRLIRSVRGAAGTPGMDGGCPDEREVLVDGAKTAGMVRSLSFYGFLKERLVAEARRLADEKIYRIMISNKCVFNFGGSDPEPAVYWLFRTLATDIRGDMGDFDFGIEILSGCNFWAVDIACRCGLSFTVMDFPDGFSRTRMAALMARACMMSAGKSRPALLAKVGRGDLAKASGLDGVVIEQFVGMAPFVRLGIWNMLDDGNARVMVENDDK